MRVAKEAVVMPLDLIIYQASKDNVILYFDLKGGKVRDLQFSNQVVFCLYS